jgi:hypothetical protein
MTTFAVVLIFAILNRASGSQLFGLTESTEIGRLVSMMLMASAITLAMPMQPFWHDVLFSSALSGLLLLWW